MVTAAAAVGGGGCAAAYAAGYVRRRHIRWGTDPRLSLRAGAAAPAERVLEVGPDWVDLARPGGLMAAWGVGGEATGGAAVLLQATSGIAYWAPPTAHSPHSGPDRQPLRLSWG